MIIFVIRSFKFFATSQAIVFDCQRRGRKVRTTQSNAPVNSRVAGFKPSEQTVPQKITAFSLSFGEGWGEVENVR